MARFERVKPSTQEIFSLQENVASAVEPLLANAVLSGNLLESLTFTAGVAQDVSHGLGRAWQGWLPVDVKPAASSGWTAPSLVNSWVNFGAGYTGAGYRLGFDGRVALRGLLKDGTDTDGTTMFTLPAGFRPSGGELFAVVTNGALGVVGVHADGTVTAHFGIDNTNVSLSGITFSVASTAEPAPLYRSVSPDETRLLRLTSSFNADIALYVF